ncbi:MAG: hypothetical protein CSA83_01495 [Actinomycetales bacterium]|nr:MAG: hypothetical protein CSA83_01495 [Actinomycetales bacterium]
MKRIVAGAVLFLIFAGEIMVGLASGLFTPAGFIAIMLMYLAYFYLFDAIARRYNLNLLGGFLVSFALYSVLVTGFLHSEIADYVLHPEHIFFTHLIRIQAALYPMFAYQIFRMRRSTPLTEHPAGSPQQISKPALLRPLLVFIALAVILSPTHQFGLWNIGHTVQTAPTHSLVFAVLGLLAFWLGIRQKAEVNTSVPASLSVWSKVFLIVAVIPVINLYVILVIPMIIVGLVYISKKRFRSVQLAW